MISFEGVSFRFGSRSQSWVLKEFDLRIATGEFHVMVGASGCGKTTALNLLAGFEAATSGRVTVDGRAITSPGPDRIVIFQGDDSLMPWLTARQNVEFPLRMQGAAAREREKTARDYLGLVGLSEHEAKFPNELSGGMKQRIQIARALVCRSPILLMDEPFGALDALTRASLQEELSLVWQRTGCTIFFITHDIAEAILLADQVSVMRKGPGAGIKETFSIDLPRPRSQGDPNFSHYFQVIHASLAAEVRSRELGSGL